MAESSGLTTTPEAQSHDAGSPLPVAGEVVGEVVSAHAHGRAGRGTGARHGGPCGAARAEVPGAG
jgi:hypothetical protein